MYADTGVFVCFEGGDGSGKSTQSRRLREALEAEGYAVLLTFEPGDTPVGRTLREIVLSPETGELSDRTETLVYAADKAEHVDTVVWPALRRGEVVVTDRYVDSTLAYQGAGRVLDLAGLEQVARWATGDLRPHLTVVLDLGARRRPGPLRGPGPDRGRVAGVPPAGPGSLPAAGGRRPRPLPRGRRPAGRRGDRGAGARPGPSAAGPRGGDHVSRLGRPGRPAPRRRGPA